VLVDTLSPDDEDAFVALRVLTERLLFLLAAGICLFLQCSTRSNVHAGMEGTLLSNENLETKLRIILKYFFIKFAI